ncbi:UNVERIFIED_CONTAM: hypothetical protein Sangu_1396500 [Sesamum angustifolium]|uniref:MD-2-related lipid-recognition domain-containing protein n=1 Tax=Sesamum angustifolium TaxID=2727405 RepID=A0AAW2N4V7_9LAMI
MVQMKLLGGLVLALCLFVPLTSAKSTDVHYCNKKANYAVKVNGLEIDPYPISRGKNTTFQIAAATNEAIKGGKLVIDVSYFGFHIHSEDHNLCAETSCPVTVGDFVVSHSQELPGITPPVSHLVSSDFGITLSLVSDLLSSGSYTLKMTMVDEHKKQLTCITFDFSIGFIAEENSKADM